MTGEAFEKRLGQHVVWAFVFVSILNGVACGSDTKPGMQPDAGPPDANPSCRELDCDAGLEKDAVVDAVVDASATDCEPGQHRADKEGCVPCEEGSYSTAKNAQTCEKWVTCVAGTFVMTPGSSTSNRVCESCESGFYSDAVNQDTCAAWTECEPGYREEMPGSATQDRSCAFEEWTRQFGANAYIYSVAVGPGGRIAVAGYTSGALMGQSNLGGSDAFVRVYDASGTALWTRQFGTNQDERGESVAIDSNGNIVVVGFTRGLLPGQPDDGGMDAFVRVYDTSGTEKWTRQFGSGSDDYGAAVSTDSSNNILVAGYTQGAFPSQIFEGKSDAFVRAYDSTGKELWTRQLGSDDTDLVDDVAVDMSGNVAVVGITLGAITGETSKGERDAFIRVYNSSGLEQWTHQFGSADYDRTVGVSADKNGWFAVAGYTEGTLSGQAAWGVIDSFVRLYSAAGAELWTRQFGNEEATQAEGIAVAPNGNIVTTGTTSGAFSGFVLGGPFDGFVQVYDDKGVAVWTHQFGTDGDEQPYSVAVDANSNLTVAGFTSGVFPGQVSGNSFIKRFKAR